MINSPDTIVALSSGRLPAGIAVIRISGPHCQAALKAVAGIVPQPRHATLAALSDSQGELIDRGLVLFFPAPHSFTGEDCAELQVHGSRAVAATLLSELSGIGGVRLAEAGEFTRRAFLNGKMDLLQAEGLADLIAAETEAQRRLAVHNSEGAQSALYARWRERILHARAMIEAELDFADESDVPGSVSDAVWADVAALSSDIQTHVNAYRRAEIIRDGFEVVIIGPPNAGKSSLLNALARRDVAIVSEEPGTTRDLVETVLNLGGLKVRLTDTAGIRSGAGLVESMGIERARERAGTADLVLNLFDPASGEIAQAPADVPALMVATKLDLGRASVTGALGISVKSGDGLTELVAEIERRARNHVGAVTDVLPSRTRHLQYLKACGRHLDQALLEGASLELRAEELRLAGDHLGRISGKVDPDQLLGVIFSQFCIGK